MERERGDLPLPNGDRVAAKLGQHLDPIADLLDPRGPDEHGPEWWAVEPGQFDVVFEAGELTTESVAAGSDVDQPEVVTIGDNHAGAGAQYGQAGPGKLPDQTAEPALIQAHGDRGALTTGEDQTVEFLQVIWISHLNTKRTGRSQMSQVRGETTLERKYADPER